MSVFVWVRGGSNNNTFSHQIPGRSLVQVCVRVCARVCMCVLRAFCACLFVRECMLWATLEADGDDVMLLMMS